MKKTTHLCVDLKEIAQQNLLKNGQTHSGVLTRTDGYHFLFEEQAREAVARNPKVFRGEYLNVAKNAQGHYVVNMRRLELTPSTDPLTVADQIFVELEQAKMSLGL